MQRELLRRSRLVWLSPEVWKRRAALWIGAVAVGGIAVLFARAAEYAGHLFGRALATSQFLPLLITPALLALVVIITRRFFPGSEGSGIPQAMAALALSEKAPRRRLLSLKIATSKIFLTVMGLAAGASVGREGPTVQIGAAIMNTLGEWFRIPPRHELERGLILAGGAAGVAAAFNTPLAGIVFAIEELSRSFEQRTSGTILTAVIVAGIVAIALAGDYTYFGRTNATLTGKDDWIAVVVCGLACGLVGGLFSRFLILSAEGLPGRLGVWSKAYPVRFAASCGLVLAVIGLASGGNTYGTGYEQARVLLEGKDSLPETYGVLKFLATLVSYASGIPGGIFAPSLSVGAGLGANLSAILPYAPVSAVAVLSMAAYFAGVVQAPITALVIVMEMTDNHDMVVPLMAASLLGAATSRLVCRRPLYKALSDRWIEKVAPQHAAEEARQSAREEDQGMRHGAAQPAPSGETAVAEHDPRQMALLPEEPPRRSQP